MRKADPIQLLVLGQTPPPFVGQMLSIESVVKAKYEDIQIHHVRMNYSQTIGDIGTFKIRKLFHLLRVILESVYCICRYRIDVIYYPPGAQTIPLIRDIATLLPLRVFRRKLILVFHASGLSERVPMWKAPFRWLFRLAFSQPDAAVQKSLLNPPDGEYVNARRIYCMPNGVADEAAKYLVRKAESAVPVILFVGIVRPDKGVDVLLEAARILKTGGHRFLVRIVGEFACEEYYQKVVREIDETGLNDCVKLCGPKVDHEKWKLFQSADIFCFPSHYASESFGNVLLEAMMFQLPVVATRWRGIPDIVVENDTGFLVPIKDAEAVATKLGHLLVDKGLRERLGKKGRDRYLEKFTVEQYLANTREVVLAVVGQDSKSTITEDLVLQTDERPTRFMKSPVVKN